MRAWWNWGASRAPPAADAARRASGSGRNFVSCQRAIKFRAPQQEDSVDFGFRTGRNRICGHGGIGRLGGFRFHCESVQVRVLLPAPIIKGGALASPFIIGNRYRTRTDLNATVQWTVAATSSKAGCHHSVFESCCPHREKKRSVGFSFFLLHRIGLTPIEIQPSCGQLRPPVRKLVATYNIIESCCPSQKCTSPG